MSIADWLILAAIVAALLLAVRRSWKNRGKCCGDCSACQSCGTCQKQDKDV